MWEWLYDVSAWVIPLVIAITFHEAAHGYMARLFGDQTATVAGRVTLNPLKHVDRVGTIVIPGLLMLMQSPILFGYAKPVPVNFDALKPQRLGIVMVALAGIMLNLVLAILAALALHIEHWIAPEDAEWLFMNLYRMVLINCLLAVFNLLPVLPLDGGRVISGLLPPKQSAWWGRTEKIGMLLILLVLFLPALFNEVVYNTGISPSQYLIGIPTMTVVEQVLHLAGVGDTP